MLLRDVPLVMTLGKDDERVGYVKLQGFSTSAAAELAYVIGQLQVCAYTCPVPDMLDDGLQFFPRTPAHMPLTRTANAPETGSGNAFIGR